MKRLTALFALAMLGCSGLAFAQAKEIKIAHVYDKTGALEAYAKQTHTGLMMGLEYATGGKMEVLGRRIVVIEKDSQFKPDVGKAQLAAAFGDDKADLAIGPTGSGVALANMIWCASVVLPLPGAPAMMLKEYSGRPPPRISSRPGTPVGSCRMVTRSLP